MGVGKPVITIAWEGIFIFRRSISAVKPSLVPFLRVAVQFGMREFNFLPLLNRDTTKFSIGAIYKLCTPVQMKKVPEQHSSGLFLQVHFTEDLEVAYIGHRVGSNILRVELEAGKNVPEKL